MIFTAKDELYHNANNVCHICSKPFKNKKETTVMKLVNKEDPHVIYVI